MRLSWTVLVTSGLCLGVGIAPALAEADFQWRGRLASGQVIEIKGVNGDVSATPSASGDVEVTAPKTANRSNPADVRIEVVPSSHGVTLCAVYPSVPRNEPNRCAPGDQGHMNTQNNDTRVHFDVRVPAGIGFVAHTVNGEINAESLQGDVDVQTVNGSIHVTTSGTATAATVNGSVNVTVGAEIFRTVATSKR